MPYIQEQAAEKVDVSVIAQFIGLAAVITFLPFLIHLQWITGPIVNALLILILFIVGIRAALLMSLVPSVMALAGGLLPAVLAPVVPFIMIGNAIFILSVDYLYRAAKNQFNGYWIGVIAGGALKYLFIYFNTNLMINLLLKKSLATAVMQIVAWPQMATAFAGGMIAFVILKRLKRI
ncbi:MAG TPA: ECF transporter S component [Candidatus Methylomirabilis sp.]|nr:ECF transporter S component [Candidatus Methylomirabilis sp.]